MDKYAEIVDGVVTNIMKADKDFADQRGLILCDENAEIGGTYVNGTFFRKPVEVTPPTADEVRSTRNSLLTRSDWTQLPDAPVDSAAWATYRQALRDITEQTGFPENVTWPTQPQ